MLDHFPLTKESRKIYNLLLVFFLYSYMSDKEQQTVLQQRLAGQEKAAKPSRIPDQTIAFVQRAFSEGADDKLNQRLRILLAHAVTKPHLPLQELASFAGVRTAERTRQLCSSAIKALWLASPQELQQRYPLADLLRRKRGTRTPHSPEARAKITDFSDLWVGLVFKRLSRTPPVKVLSAQGLSSLQSASSASDKR
jgi:hypothetical protein